jgi:hypothetical protein
LPRAALGKDFAKGLRGFAESLGPSAKEPAPVVKVSAVLHSQEGVMLDFRRSGGQDKRCRLDMNVLSSTCYTSTPWQLMQAHR